MKPRKIILSCLLILAFANSKTLAQNDTISSPSGKQLLAFAVLKKRCNNCHKIRNPDKYFTLENMDRLSSKIHKQVFVFERMPKGKRRREKMPEAEYEALKNWIETALKK